MNSRAGKYDPLSQFLRSSSGSRIRAAFRQLERMLGGKLPASARQYCAWWANDRSHVQAKAWLTARYNVHFVEMGQEWVMFERVA